MPAPIVGVGRCVVSPLDGPPRLSREVTRDATSQGAGGYRFAEHGGEVEIELEGATERDIFASALAAFAELTADAGDRRRAEREVEIEAQDAAMLLVDWINELVILAEHDGFIPERLRAFELDGTRLRAEIAGRTGPTRDLVKAATLHGLELHRTAAGWRGRVVIDV